MIAAPPSSAVSGAGGSGVGECQSPSSPPAGQVLSPPFLPGPQLCYHNHTAYGVRAHCPAAEWDVSSGWGPRLSSSTWDLHPSSAHARPRLHPPAGQGISVGAPGPLEPRGDTGEGDTGAALSVEHLGELLAWGVPGASSWQECWGGTVPSQPLQPAWGPASALVCAQPGAQA